MKLLFSYIRIYFITIVIIIALRLIETVLIIITYGLQESLISSELIGFIYDLLFSNLLLVICSPIYFLLFRICKDCAQKVFAGLIIFASIVHLLILKFFLYQLVPLDIVLFQTPLDEIMFTVKTSETRYTSLIVSIVLLVGIVVISNRFLIHKKLPKKVVYAFYLLVLITIPIFLSIPGLRILSLNKYEQNKSIYFYNRTLSYLAKSDNEPAIFTQADSKSFNEAITNHNNIDPAYPLLHVFDTTNVLSHLIQKEDTIPPNIVILIVEGLNDDFIHTYKGVELMPFLNKLMTQSLYWKNCVSAGERSFAVVPSVTGGLPYGKIGFTSLEILPRHLSLVSVLHANDYYTSFFYGQGSWFHKKDRFFQMNHIDLVFDNERFDPKYEKIIVGDDRFFWGYNDKELFNQSFTVLDTLPQHKRLEIYFTGTSHSPFVISNEMHYDHQFKKLVEQIPEENEKMFFTRYTKYIKSILFLDDALEEFFNDYRTRPEFENTIFIITGDHPMTEIPITNSIKRYHVPLLIYSPIFKEPRTYSNVVSHLDLYETILALLASDYNIEVPNVSTSIGSKLLPIQNESKTVVFMTDNKEISDIYSEGYYLSKNNLFKVKDGLLLEEIQDDLIMQSLTDKLNMFKRVNQYVCLNNKIIPDKMYYESLGFHMIYSRIDTNRILFNSEYYTIIDKIPIPNSINHFDFSLKYRGKIDENNTIVYQVSDRNGNILMWENFGLNNDEKSTQVNIRIPQFSIIDTTIFFQSFIWNQSRQKINYYNLNTSLYSE